MMAAIKGALWLEAVVFILALSLWLAAAPLSLSRDFSPAELIENALPAKQTIQSASKSDFLAAVCEATRRNRKSGAGITAAACAGRGELASEVVGAVLRCARKVDCEYVGAIVSAAVMAQPRAETAISDAAIARAPDCGETIQRAVRAAAKSEGGQAAAGPAGPNALSGPRPGADEGFDPREPLVLVCADGMERTIRKSQVEEFLRVTPGSFLGSCPPATPTSVPPTAPLTPTPTPAPSPTLTPTHSRAP